MLDKCRHKKCSSLLLCPLSLFRPMWLATLSTIIPYHQKRVEFETHISYPTFVIMMEDMNGDETQVSSVKIAQIPLAAYDYEH